MTLTPDQVYRRRKALGLTQQQLAHRLRVSVSTVANWEAGRYEPPGYLELALDLLDAIQQAKRRANAEKAPASPAGDDA